jgi:3-hydroxybutyryl-CoA dehydratase
MIRDTRVAYVGEVFSQQVTLTEASITAFATSCGDANPLHHDREYARQTRFESIIACGPHYASLFMGLVATHFSKSSPMLGLEFSLKFLRPVRAESVLTMRWRVTEVERKESLNGDIVSLQGEVTNGQGTTVLAATGKILLTPTL